MSDLQKLASTPEGDAYDYLARELVRANRERYPELLEHQIATAMRREAQAISQASQDREAALVSLRLLGREGKLKPTTDDERAVVDWVQSDPRFHGPAPQRRLAHPLAENYPQMVYAQLEMIAGGEATHAE